MRNVFNEIDKASDNVATKVETDSLPAYFRRAMLSQLSWRTDAYSYTLATMIRRKLIAEA